MVSHLLIHHPVVLTTKKWGNVATETSAPAKAHTEACYLCRGSCVPGSPLHGWGERI